MATGRVRLVVVTAPPPPRHWWQRLALWWSWKVDHWQRMVIQKGDR